MAIKFCTKCGKKFESIGREVICPACKQAAAEESKKAAVMRTKRASWAGKSVPVRISGRASTLIRKYGEANSLPFAEALDALLKSTSFFEKLGVEWSTIVPYKSRRRDKSTATSTTQDVAQAAKTTSKKVASKATSKATSTTAGSKAATAAGKG